MGISSAGGEEHQPLAPFIGAVVPKADSFPKMPPPRAAVIIQLRISRPVFPCPMQQRPGTFLSQPHFAEGRVDAIFHDEALAVLRREDHGHCEADLLRIPLKKQEKAAILRPSEALHDLVMERFAKEIFQILLIGPGEDVPLVVDMKLFPKGSDVLFQNSLPDGDLVFHFLSSKHLIRRVRKREPSIHDPVS